MIDNLINDETDNDFTNTDSISEDIYGNDDTTSLSDNTPIIGNINLGTDQSTASLQDGTTNIAATDDDADIDDSGSANDLLKAKKPTAPATPTTPPTSYKQVINPDLYSLAGVIPYGTHAYLGSGKQYTTKVTIQSGAIATFPSGSTQLVGSVEVFGTLIIQGKSAYNIGAITLQPGATLVIMGPLPKILKAATGSKIVPGPGYDGVMNDKNGWKTYDGLTLFTPTQSTTTAGTIVGWNQWTNPDVLDTSAVPCFLTGTLIQTPSGEVPVESLQIGDTVIVYDSLNQKETERPLIWVGSNHNHFRADLPEDIAGYPVCIQKDAIADNVPHTDLFVTPEHCMFFEDKFVPARMLVNGSSIFYDRSQPSYQYFHIETEDHSVIMANGALTESYLNTGNRNLFKQHNELASLIQTQPKTWEADAYVPLVTERGLIEPLHQQLKSRAEQRNIQDKSLPHACTHDPDLHLITDKGIQLNSIQAVDNRFVFMIPAEVQSVNILSRSSRPNEAIGPFVDDRRELGILVGEITLFDSQSSHNIDTHLQEEKLNGWHSIESPLYRWTMGDAELPLNRQTQQGLSYLAITVKAAGPYIVSEEKIKAKIA